jgi:hypothetical protein
LASQPKGASRSRRSLGAEEAAALRDAADRLEEALGQEVKVRPRGEDEISVEIRFDSLGDALALASGLRRERR